MSNNAVLKSSEIHVSKKINKIKNLLKLNLKCLCEMLNAYQT